MPAVAEPPKPSAPNVIQQIAMSGKSAADLFQESGGKTDVPAEPPSDFNTQLSAAQAADKGKPAPAAPAAPKPAEAAAPATPPKVPGLPTAAPVDEWKPKGETAKHFDILKAKHSQEIATRDAELNRIKADLDAAKAHGSAEDVAALKKELNEYRETLRDVAIERDPEFKARFSTKENAAIDAIKMAAGEKAEKVEKLLKMPNSPWRDEQLNKIAEDLPASSQRRFNAGLQLLEQVDVERTAEIATRRATFEQKQSLTMAQQRERDATVQKQMETEFSAVHSEWTDQTKGHPFFTEREGDKEHNEAVQNARALSKAIFSGQLSPKELATAAHWAATGPLALQGWQAATKRAEAAEAALDKLRGVDPGDGRQDGLEGEGSAPAPAPGSAEYLRYMNSQLKAAQAKDFSARRGVK